MTKAYLPAVRAALGWGKRPTTVIMRDDWFGHRDPLTGEPLGDRDEWLDWDHALAYAFQTIEDYSDSAGLLQWQLDDEAVEVNAIRKINKFQAAVDVMTKSRGGKPYEPKPGEYFVADLFTRRADGHIQTYREWVEKQVADNGV